MPKYNTTEKEIVYTIDEAAVDDYDKTIDGYNLINTYRENTLEVPENPRISTPTGDANLTMADSNVPIGCSTFVLSQAQKVCHAILPIRKKATQYLPSVIDCKYLEK